ncbi:MAG: DNA/RNA non-specific endonuclease [Selenomonadaceae bacterium]|nr:DNA/RNA non-specific endonuclease [Selenomonadaceae bacterium]
MPRKKQKKPKTILSLILGILLLLAGYAGISLPQNLGSLPDVATYVIERLLSGHVQEPAEIPQASGPALKLSEIPPYRGEPYATLRDNQPGFTDSDLSTGSFETYSELDSLGRCGVAFANIGKDLMPTGKRESIGQVKPSGWHTVKYDNIEAKYLYNRCHLIGYQLTAENANRNNLITGTRYMNESMIPFEDKVADYVKKTGKHVLYRVTPIFQGNDLVARGVQMEALSVEDRGESIRFHVFCYNVQPGIDIDYSTGESKLKK